MKRQGSNTIFINFQLLDRSYLSDTKQFFHYFAGKIVNDLNLDTDMIDRIWRKAITSPEKATELMREYVLPKMPVKLLIAIDEVDLILGSPVNDSFFGMLRTWYENLAWDSVWSKLNILMAVSTEPSLFIIDPLQSPFNVGEKIYLDDFDESQVRELNVRYRSPLNSEEVVGLIDLLGGHPFLTSKALYTIIANDLSWEKLQKQASTDRGPFGDHLRRYWWGLRDDESLVKALRSVLTYKSCADERAFDRLSRAGLLKGDEPRSCEFRCKLYEQYFRNKLL
jgi:hypothetical protein